MQLGLPSVRFRPPHRHYATLLRAQRIEIRPNHSPPLTRCGYLAWGECFGRWRSFRPQSCRRTSPGKGVDAWPICVLRTRRSFRVPMESDARKPWAAYSCLARFLLSRLLFPGSDSRHQTAHIITTMLVMPAIFWLVQAFKPVVALPHARVYITPAATLYDCGLHHNPKHLRQSACCVRLRVWKRAATRVAPVLRLCLDALARTFRGAVSDTTGLAEYFQSKNQGIRWSRLCAQCDGCCIIKLRLGCWRRSRQEGP